MAAVFGATSAAISISSSRKLHLPSRRSLPGRKASFVVVRSDAGANPGHNARARRADQLITNAVATKADGAAASAPSKPGHELLLFEALREGLEEEMARDPTVCVMGEDVGHYGGSYKVTKGLAEKYGDLRVLDTPIAENSFTGMGIGAAMTGLRPIIEGMNMGFLLLAFNQISNNCGMLHYTSGGQFKIPVVIRGPGGVGRQLGAEHSQPHFQCLLFTIKPLLPLLLTKCHPVEPQCLSLALCISCGVWPSLPFRQRHCRRRWTMLVELVVLIADFAKRKLLPP